MPIRAPHALVALALSSFGCDDHKPPGGRAAAPSGAAPGPASAAPPASAERPAEAGVAPAVACGLPSGVEMGPWRGVELGLGDGPWTFGCTSKAPVKLSKGDPPNTLDYQVYGTAEHAKRLNVVLHLDEPAARAATLSAVSDLLDDLLSKALVGAVPPERMRAALLEGRSGTWRVGSSRVSLARDDYVNKEGIEGGAWLTIRAELTEETRTPPSGVTPSPSPDALTKALGEILGELERLEKVGRALPRTGNACEQGWIRRLSELQAVRTRWGRLKAHVDKRDSAAFHRSVLYTDWCLACTGTPLRACDTATENIEKAREGLGLPEAPPPDAG